MIDGVDWLARLRLSPKTGTSLAAQPPAPSASAGAAPPPGGDVAEATRLIEDLRAAIRRAGILHDDPMMPVMTAFAQSIQFMAERGSMSDHVMASASERIQAALVEARHTANAEAERFSARILATETDIIRRIAGSIAASADRALTRRVEVFDRNTALWAAAMLFSTALACGVGGYVWGGNAARANIQETEAGLRAAFARGPDQARIWLDLMTWNDIGRAEAQCAAIGFSHVQDGRRGCTIPLWTEPPAVMTLAPVSDRNLGQALDQAQRAIREAQTPSRPREKNPLPRVLPAPTHGVGHFGPADGQ